MKYINEKLLEFFDIQKELSSNDFETKYKAIQISNNKTIILTILNSSNIEDKEKFFNVAYRDAQQLNDMYYDIGELNGISYYSKEVFYTKFSNDALKNDKNGINTIKYYQIKTNKSMSLLRIIIVFIVSWLSLSFLFIIIEAIVELM